MNQQGLDLKNEMQCSNKIQKRKSRVWADPAEMDMEIIQD